MVALQRRRRYAGAHSGAHGRNNSFGWLECEQRVLKRFQFASIDLKHSRAGSSHAGVCDVVIAAVIAKRLAAALCPTFRISQNSAVHAGSNGCPTTLNGVVSDAIFELDLTARTHCGQIKPKRTSKTERNCRKIHSANGPVLLSAGGLSYSGQVTAGYQVHVRRFHRRDLSTARKSRYIYSPSRRENPAFLQYVRAEARERRAPASARQIRSLECSS